MTSTRSGGGAMTVEPVTGSTGTTAVVRNVWLSCFPGLFGQVAQLVEQRTENPRVGSSILPLATATKPRHGGAFSLPAPQCVAPRRRGRARVRETLRSPAPGPNRGTSAPRLGTVPTRAPSPTAHDSGS